MFHVEPALLSDVDFVLSNLSEITARELDLISKTKEQYRDYITRHFLAAETIYDDDTPAFVMGYEIHKTLLFTWFLATDAFFHSHRSIAFGRDYMQRVKGRFPRHGVFSISALQGGKTKRWFELMGASLVHICLAHPGMKAQKLSLYQF